MHQNLRRFPASSIRSSGYFPSVLLLGTIILLILASFVPQAEKLAITNGIICVGIFILGLAREVFLKQNHDIVRRALKEIHYFTLLLLTGLPVVSGIAALMGVSPYLLYFGLIGASANITGLGILRREGHEVSVATFMRIGVPYTLAAVMVGYALIWLIWR